MRGASQDMIEDAVDRLHTSTEDDGVVMVDEGGVLVVATRGALAGEVLALVCRALAGAKAAKAKLKTK